MEMQRHCVHPTHVLVLPLHRHELPARHQHQEAVVWAPPRTRGGFASFPRHAPRLRRSFAVASQLHQPRARRVVHQCHHVAVSARRQAAVQSCARRTRDRRRGHPRPRRVETQLHVQGVAHTSSRAFVSPWTHANDGRRHARGKCRWTVLTEVGGPFTTRRRRPVVRGGDKQGARNRSPRPIKEHAWCMHRSPLLPACWRWEFTSDVAERWETLRGRGCP
mmetsp:Transcript_10654/g.65681  ORF Transcript_10654/g.65681 Transcript_10654/m.65681 type:complete len:220 (-) Transcript_10654:2481-3140(-)